MTFQIVAAHTGLAARLIRRGGALLVLASLSLAAFELRAAEPASPRERLPFNSDWRFIKGDPAGAEGKRDYQTLKPWLLAANPDFAPGSVSPSRPAGNPGGEVSYTQPDCDDSNWRTLNLPHDWGIEGPFKQEYPGETGKLQWWGVAWYRKHFTLPAEDAGKNLYLDVDGAMAYASVWLNGQFVGGWPYGYASWRLDLTPCIKAGAENVLAIRLDNPPDSSRWYPGGGLYRNVWLVRTAPVHVAHWGDYVTTPEITRSAATVHLALKLDNRSTTEANLEAAAQIYELNAAGQKSPRPVASLGPASLTVGAGASDSVSLTNTVRNPKLWSLARPNRYVAVTTIAQDGKVVDRCETPFGIRTLQFTADNGFLLNGERVPLNGVCDHHDLGAMGSAINTRALQRQIELLQEMGCNAIRTSHNPPAPELLDLCDRMGMVVMDEAFDCWLRQKKKNDYHLLFADWHEQDVRALVRRDRNHPCVILWSIGNEIPEQGSTNGIRIAGELASIVRSEDTTRPVTSACNNTRAGYNGFQKQLDVFGYNYKPGEYGRFRDANPNQPLFGSETASCVSSRGEYFFPLSNDQSQGRANFQVSSYDLYAPRWATPPDTEFRGQDEFPFVAGEFVWTGFDYLGEPTPYNADTSNLLNFTEAAQKARMQQELKALGKLHVPSRSSYFGIIDLAGFKKDRFYLYQARWRPDLHMAHILPHWNWPDRVGEVTPVHVYTSGDEAELFLNGKSLGRKKRGPTEYRLHWDDVVYHPGELKVIAYKNHNRWAHDVVETTGSANKLMLQADRSTIDADGQDLSFVTVAIADWAGRQVPRSKNHVSFELTGPGEIVAVDNGDATSFESFQGKERNAYNGLCLVVVRSTGQPGEIAVKASALALQPAEVKIKSVAAR
ncbi:MAG TPA: beta-galactosidase GalB [Candidatus Acidoferrum sp.]|jgi:beta-galactosidase|nr:beta-galactosidase GalB [Candidatus Acidoferrum sp.]